MTIHLPEDLERFVQAKVLSGRFASEEEAITEAVRLLRQRESELRQAGSLASAGLPVAERPPAWKQILEMMKDVPEAVFERIPADGSEQLDHYVYGTPRRPVS